MDATLLILRLTVGLIIAAHGAQKLFGWFGGHGVRGTSEWLASQGFRPPILWGVLGGLSEFGGGLLFALGLFSPLGSIGIGASMLVVITKIHWPKFWGTEGGFEYPLVNFAAAIAVGIAGPGSLSLDALWGTLLPSTISLIAALLVALGYVTGMVISAERPKPRNIPAGEAHTS